MGKRMANEWNASLQGKYLSKPKKVVGLAEHHYGPVPEEEDLDEAIARARLCVRNAYENRAFKEARDENETRLMSLELLDSYLLAGTKVWAKIDLAWVDRDGDIEIVDWKTGRVGQAATRIQMGVYAMDIGANRGVDYERITCTEIGLAEAVEVPHDVDDTLIQEAIHTIVETSSAMKDKLVDVDRNIASEEDFERTTFPRVCYWCNFRSECEDWISSMS